nr:MBL fold metallo-hydrolase [uncultured Chryseobacterium sp.]
MNHHLKKDHGFIHIPCNDLDIFILSDGYFGIGYHQPILAPEIPQNLVKNELRSLYLSDSYFEAPINVMLVKKGDRMILVDTGEGFYDEENAGNLLYSLTAAGFSTDSVTDVLITHAHRDHIGGILSKNGNIVFPNARYHISRQEFEFWMTGEPYFQKSKNPEGGKSSIPLVRNILSTIKDKLSLFEMGDHLFSCIQTQPAPGHTPGHIIYTVYDGNLSITNVVDILHSPLLIAKPDWGTQWDIDFEKGVETRKKVLQQCYENRTLISASHLPWPGIGYINKVNEQFQWIPKVYNDPFSIRLTTDLEITTL